MAEGQRRRLFLILAHTHILLMYEYYPIVGPFFKTYMCLRNKRRTKKVGKKVKRGQHFKENC